MWISKYPWISQMKSPDIYNMIWLVPCDFSSTFRKKAGPRPPLSPGHAVDLLVDVIPMLLAFKGNWFQSLFLSSCGKWKAGIFGALFPLIAEICWNDIGNVLPFGYFEFIHCFSGINQKHEKNNISKFVWANVWQPLAISHQTIAEVWKVYKGLAKQEPRMQGRSLTSRESRAVLFRRKLPLARGIPQIYNLLQFYFLGLNLWNPIIWIRGDIITW